MRIGVARIFAVLDSKGGLGNSEIFLGKCTTKSPSQNFFFEFLSYENGIF